MWGECLLISPVLEQNKRNVYAYFPKSRWFDYYTGIEVEKTGQINELDAPLDHLPLHVRGGCILVTQKSAMNTQLRFYFISCFIFKLIINFNFK
jgi:alpha-glucosidase (family GH31 glycosyl hydrolase)